MAQINLVRVKSDRTVPQWSQKDDRFGHRGKFIWKIGCLLECMDSEPVGSHWPGTSTLFTMLSFIRDDDVAHTHTHIQPQKHILHPLVVFFYYVPRVCTNAIYLYDSIGFSVIICRMKRARNFPGITHTNTEKCSALCGIGWDICWQSHSERERPRYPGKAKMKKRSERQLSYSFSYLSAVFTFTPFVSPYD